MRSDAFIGSFKVQSLLPSMSVLNTVQILLQLFKNCISTPNGNNNNNYNIILLLLNNNYNIILLLLNNNYYIILLLLNNNNYIILLLLNNNYYIILLLLNNNNYIILLLLNNNNYIILGAVDGTRTRKLMAYRVSCCAFVPYLSTPRPNMLFMNAVLEHHYLHL